MKESTSALGSCFGDDDDDEELSSLESGPTKYNSSEEDNQPPKSKKARRVNEATYQQEFTPFADLSKLIEQACEKQRQLGVELDKIRNEGRAQKPRKPHRTRST